ncbi:Fe2OG dioxygenase domain-containing protein [Citrus sinensis]|uniref:Fe2OG dioxygenase domain-containing protein n=1 Tax=Citrus sinensis TaxID=2711 RepID=A0ACB8IFG6_CITSI|nr:Fe2OG dioxygenase domain-containing protein [Citrus sinensis]
MGEVDEAFIQALEHRPKLSVTEAEGIPLIDLSALSATSTNIKNPDSTISDLVQQIGNACKNWGFFQVINHGVPFDKRRSIENAARKFFEQPLEEKRKVRRDEKKLVGYYDTEHTKNVRDWKEVFDFVVESPCLMPASPEPEDKEVAETYSQWPDYPPELREAFEEYAKEVEKLAYKLIELVALSLGLPANRFNGFFKDQTTFARLNHYPPCPAPHLTLGLGRHKDSGALTILAQDDVGGLEVWSNDAYETVEHRVVVNSEKERLSIPILFNPSHYTIMKPLDELINEQNPAKYRAYNWGKYFTSRLHSNLKKLDVENLQIYHFKVQESANKLDGLLSINKKRFVDASVRRIGTSYLDLASIITADIMSYDDAYALLLTHEARLEHNQIAKYVFNANYGMVNSNYSLGRDSGRRRGYGCSRYHGHFNVGNMNHYGGRGMFFHAYSKGFPNDNGSYNLARGYSPQMPIHKASSHNKSVFNMSHDSFTDESSDNALICQICHKSSHTADACWHRYTKNYIAPPSDMNPYYILDTFSIFGVAYIANFEGPADQGWYLDSGATHHLTNNVANMNIREELRGSDQLIIGNGQGLPITHIGDAFLTFKSSNTKHHHPQIALKDILLVPSITKNLLSISKLTSDNHLYVEFVGNICYVKYSLKRQVLLQGLAEKGLYRLLLKSSPSSSSPSSFLSYSIPSSTTSPTPLFMLSCCYINSAFDGVQLNNLELKSCFESSVSLCKPSINKITFRCLPASTKNLINLFLNLRGYPEL